MWSENLLVIYIKNGRIENVVKRTKALFAWRLETFQLEFLWIINVQNYTKLIHSLNKPKTKIQFHMLPARGAYNTLLSETISVPLCPRSIASSPCLRSWQRWQVTTMSSVGAWLNSQACVDDIRVLFSGRRWVILDSWSMNMEDCFGLYAVMWSTSTIHYKGCRYKHTVIDVIVVGWGP